jgi:hypothetical protein
MSLRHLHRNLARLALVWFALALGVAAASPWVSPRDYQLVCAEGTVKLVAVGDNGPADVQHSHQLECALCLLTGSPPGESVASFQPAAPQERAANWVRVDAPRIPGVWAPLPARGPPSLRA